MNRISDLGFQTNKVIPKASSDIVVAFFPLDRFLTPGLKKLFIKSPALFFSPYALLFDPQGEKLMQQFLEPTLQRMGIDASDFLKKLPQAYLVDYVKGLNDKAGTGCQSNLNMPSTPCADSKLSGTTDVMKFLAHASLNTVRVIVGGTMNVDVNSVAPNVASITMNEGNGNAATWKKGAHSGVIQGTFLGNGTPSITNSTDLAKTEFDVDAKSTDTTLNFTMTLADDVASGQTLTFVVTKTDKDGNKIVSAPFELPVSYSSPSLSNAIVKGTALTITGSNLSDAEKVLLSAPGAATPDVTLDSTTVGALNVKNQAEVDVDLSKTKALSSGCWMVKLQMKDSSQTNGVLFPEVDSKACQGKHPPQ